MDFGIADCADRRGPRLQSRVAMRFLSWLAVALVVVCSLVSGGVAGHEYVHVVLRGTGNPDAEVLHRCSRMRQVMGMNARTNT